MAAEAYFEFGNGIGRADLLYFQYTNMVCKDCVEVKHGGPFDTGIVQQNIHDLVVVLLHVTRVLEYTICLAGWAHRIDCTARQRVVYHYSASIALLHNCHTKSAGYIMLCYSIL